MIVRWTAGRCGFIPAPLGRPFHCCPRRAAVRRNARCRLYWMWRSQLMVSRTSEYGDVDRLEGVDAVYCGWWRTWPPISAQASAGLRSVGAGALDLDLGRSQVAFGLVVGA